jgi:hypothetical protein
MPTYALLDADLYLPPTLCTWGGGPESTEKTSKPELPVPSALSGAQMRFLISCVIQHYAPVVGWGRWRNRCIMLIMTLDPSWRQTLRLPPPGIEPGSPAAQAGTLPKELSRQLLLELRIWDFYPRSRILIFSHPRSWIQNSNKREG